MWSDEPLVRPSVMWKALLSDLQVAGQLAWLWEMLMDLHLGHLLAMQLDWRWEQIHCHNFHSFQDTVLKLKLM